jgi:hypothetical protein
MNYGKDFIKLYNKKLSVFKKEIIDRIEKDYELPDSNEDLLKKYKNEIYGKINEIKDLDNKDGYSSSLVGISRGYMDKKYKFDRIENIINKDVLSNFLEKKKYSKYQDFSMFLNSFSEYLVLHEYEKRLRDNYELFYKLIESKDVKSFFEIKYIKDDLNELLDCKKNDLKLIIIEKENEVIVKEKEMIPSIILNDDEKLLLLHLLYVCTRNVSYKLNPVEFLSVMKVTKDVHYEKKMQDFYGTDYRKVKGGIGYYKGDSSKIRSMLDRIDGICNDYKLTVIKDYIRNIYPK